MLKPNKQNKSTTCETCSNYVYDEDWEEYTDRKSVV